MSESSFDFAMDEHMARAFETIRDALATAAVDPFDRDAFLMHRTVVELIHGGRPPEGLGEAIEEFTAYIHLVFLFWLEGKQVVDVGGDALKSMLEGAGPCAHPPIRPSAYFVKAAPHRVWGSPTDLGPEPLDGWFAARRGGRLLVVAQFGGRPDRGGASVVAVEGPEPANLQRPDGSALFASTLPAGVRAGLYSLTGMEELLALAWRVERWRGGGA